MSPPPCGMLPVIMQNGSMLMRQLLPISLLFDGESSSLHKERATRYARERSEDEYRACGTAAVLHDSASAAAKPDGGTFRAAQWQRGPAPRLPYAAQPAAMSVQMLSHRHAAPPAYEEEYPEITSPCATQGE